MPHLRARHLRKLISQSLNFSPLVGIFGHRQVGKTTLAGELGKRYKTLDVPSDLEAATVDPSGFLQAHISKPLVIDECQYAPPLFPALKEWVRTHPDPGQFLLTGSIRFSSRKAIRESLTGRIITWDLLPMDLSEINGQTLPDKIIRLVEKKSVEIELKPNSVLKSLNLTHHLSRGGLPGIFAVRDVAVRAQRFETQINTMLERDLKLVLQTSLSYGSLRTLAAYLAGRQAMPLEYVEMSRQTRISVPTLRKLISALESVFFIRLIPSEGTQKKPILFFEDQGEASFLSARGYSPQMELTRFLYSELRVQTHYRPAAAIRLFAYRNRGGSHIPLCFASSNSALGIIPTLAESPPPGYLKSCESFLAHYPNSKVVFVHPGSNDRILTHRIRCLGVRQLL